MLDVSLSVGDRVVLVWPRAGDHPWILVTGTGDDYAYYQSVWELWGGLLQD